jgi:hypothetical protein
MSDEHPLKRTIDSLKKKALEIAAQSATKQAQETLFAAKVNEAWQRAQALISAGTVEANAIFQREGLQHLFKYEDVPQAGDGNLQKAKLWLICPPQYVAPLVECDITVRAKDGQISVRHNVSMIGRATHGNENFNVQELRKEEWAEYLSRLYTMVA